MKNTPEASSGGASVIQDTPRTKHGRSYLKNIKKTWLKLTGIDPDQVKKTGRDVGSMSLETVIITPAILALIALAIAAGRISIVEHTIQVVAHNAARAASLARDYSSANTEAERTANSSIAQQGLHCTSSNVIMRTESGGFSAPVGTTGIVHITVTCRISFTDLGLPGLSGSRLLTADSYSPIDRYRSR